MKCFSAVATLFTIASVLAMTAVVSTSPGEAATPTDSISAEKAVLARLGEIQKAAEGMDADKVFSYVLENDKGAVAQNGRLLLTRNEALDSTKAGFQALQKVAYHFDHHYVTLLSPTIALVVSDGSSSATTQDGRAVSARFAQTVVFVLTNSEWKVVHSHRSAVPPE